MLNWLKSRRASAQYSALPLTDIGEGRATPSTPSSRRAPGPLRQNQPSLPSRFVRRLEAIPNYRLYILLLVLVIATVASADYAVRGLQAAWKEPDSGSPAPFDPRAFEARRRPDKMKAYNASGILEAQERGFAIHSTTDVGCQLTDWHNARYASLRAPLSGREDTLRPRTILLAWNLIDAEGIIPNLLIQLPELLAFLGPRNVHISIYENGSEDATPDLLRVLAEVLDSAGTSYTMLVRGKSESIDKSFDHRIEALAALRNKALAPLYDPHISAEMPHYRFDEVLIINDVIWCPADVLEVIYQKRHTGAHQSCSVDWDWNMRVVYDRWVLRAMSGRPWYDRKALLDYWNDPRPLDSKTPPPTLPLDPTGHARFESLKPLQVFACWNGMSLFSASAFLDKGIRFRVGHSDSFPDGSHKEPTDIVSECYLVSVDLWKVGMGRIVLASRARVAYSIDDYNIYRKDRAVGRFEDLAAEQESELFEWKKEPPAQVAMHDLADWMGREERWAPWDEP